MLRATVNEQVPLQVLAADGRPDLYARAKLFRDGTELAILELPHTSDGIYRVVFTPDQEGYLTVLYQLYMDNGFTVPAPYDLEAEVLEVSWEKTNLLRLLGLMHENAVVDQQAYDSLGKLTAARVRCFSSKAAALAQDPAALLFTYQAAAAYTDGQLSFYRITREQ